MKLVAGCGWKGVQITLDGESVRDVIEADDVAGYIIRYVRGADGRLVREGEQYKAERLNGRVVFMIEH